jgi:hypothetical protein
VTNDLDADGITSRASCSTTRRLRLDQRCQYHRAVLTFGLVTFSLIAPLSFQFGDAITRAIVPILSAFDCSTFRLAPLALAPIWLLGIHDPTHNKTGTEVAIGIHGPKHNKTGTEVATGG